MKERCEQFEQQGNPIISVDCKKKELLGSFQNNGGEWQAKGEETEVNVYDVLSLAEGKAIPYGIYDLVHTCVALWLEEHLEMTVAHDRLRAVNGTRVSIGFFPSSRSIGVPSRSRLLKSSWNSSRIRPPTKAEWWQRSKRARLIQLASTSLMKIWRPSISSRTPFTANGATPSSLKGQDHGVFCLNLRTNLSGEKKAVVQAQNCPERSKMSAQLQRHQEHREERFTPFSPTFSSLHVGGPASSRDGVHLFDALAVEQLVPTIRFDPGWDGLSITHIIALSAWALWDIAQEKRKAETPAIEGSLAMALFLAKAAQDDAESVLIAKQRSLSGKLSIFAPEHIAARPAIHALRRSIPKGSATGGAGCESQSCLDLTPPVLSRVFQNSRG
jgi:hypothetical protein